VRVPGAVAPADEGVPAAEEDPAAAGARAAGHRADRVRQALVERAAVGGRGRQGLLRPRALSHLCSRRRELRF